MAKIRVNTTCELQIYERWTKFPHLKFSQALALGMMFYLEEAEEGLELPGKRIRKLSEKLSEAMRECNTAWSEVARVKGFLETRSNIINSSERELAGVKRELEETKELLRKAEEKAQTLERANAENAGSKARKARSEEAKARRVGRRTQTGKATKARARGQETAFA